MAPNSTSAGGRRTDAKTTSKMTKTMRIFPLNCCRSKTQTRPSYRLCCWRWNFRVRRLNSAVPAAGRYCGPTGTKRSASPEERQECAAA